MLVSLNHIRYTALVKIIFKLNNMRVLQMLFLVSILIDDMKHLDFFLVANAPNYATKMTVGGLYP